MHLFVKSFWEQVLQGDLVSTIQKILPSPESSYDQSPEAMHLINFVDAALFDTGPEAYLQYQILESLGQVPPQIMEGKLFELLLNPKGTREEPFFAEWLLLEGREAREPPPMPISLHPLWDFHHKMAEGWHRLKRFKPLFFKQFSQEYRYLHPWYPLQFNIPIPLVGQGVPLIFFEPVQEDLSPLLKSLDNRPAIFVFSTVAKFFQMLQQSAFVAALEDPEHYIYILELYPTEQWESQAFEVLSESEFYPVYFSSQYREYTSLVCQAMQQRNGDWLYSLSQKLLFVEQQNRLGLTRAPALRNYFTSKRWYGLHHPVGPPEKSLGPIAKDLMHVVLAELATKREPIKAVAHKPLKIAHIVPQIVSGGHAPSRLLENLVSYHHSHDFKPMVVSTELFKEHFFEYPHNKYLSQASEERGASLIYHFEQLGVKVLINSLSMNYQQAAISIADQLNKEQIDIAIFHGPDIINCMAAQVVQAPLRVLFEHGTQSAYPGFDIAILSSEAAADLYRNHYQELGTEVHALPFALDVRRRWETLSFSRAALGLPENCLVMTTISTKLDSRLSAEMCHAIAAILQKVPDSCYAPIGTIKDLERIRTILAAYGVEKRFYPLGERHNPSQLARSMHLYLNEFPEGSCLALLDAMAAGCPIVTMYDLNGPQQARYGGNYMGLDHAITSNKAQEYIELAYQLLTNQSLYKEWSAHTLKQYEKFADVKAYVHAFEEILRKAYEGRLIK